MRISDFQIKDIINVADGKKLGRLTDIDINPQTGLISAIIIERSDKKFGLFGKDEPVAIHWARIVKIGSDVILVNADQPAAKEDER